MARKFIFRAMEFTENPEVCDYCFADDEIPGINVMFSTSVIKSRIILRNNHD